MLAALVRVLVLMADGACGFQFAAQISLHCSFGVALGTDNNLNITLVENLHGSAAHATGDDDIHAHIREEVGQEAWLVSGIGYALRRNDFSVSCLKNVEVFTVTKVSPDVCSV